MFGRWLQLCLLLLVLPINSLLAAPPSPKAERLIQPFDYRGVTLRDGFLKRQFDETRAFYLSVPNDDLLRGFRVRSGKAPYGRELGGWYSDDVFHVFGQFLSGLARMHAATGDPACRDKVQALVGGWAECIAPDGFFFYSSKPNAPHYIYDKMVGGLVDAYLYTSNRDALAHLNRITEWAIVNLDRSRPYGADSNEWYTLSENLYRAYLATGIVKYRDFARVWEYTEFWNRLAARQDIFGPGGNGKVVGGYHAYSHVNTLSGAGAAYLVHGQRHYLDVIRGAYDTLQRDHCFVTGGYGPDEQLLPRTERDRRLYETENSFETQCGTWAGFKLSKYLLSFTGSAAYGDWIERLIYNGIGAGLPMTADGRAFYYANYNPHGAFKTPHPAGWACCAGTRPQAVADFHDLIYFKDADTLYVNLYAPSEVQWQQDEEKVTLRQETRYPEGDTVVFGVDLRKPRPFSLAMRNPGWLAQPARISLNGRSMQVSPDGRGWLIVRRTWRHGDRLALTLPMQFTTQRLAEEKPYPLSLLRGPVVLSLRSDQPLPRQLVDAVTSDAAFLPSRLEPLTYRMAINPSVLVRPFYAIREGERYHLYLDPSTARRVFHRDVKFSAQWNLGPNFRYSNSPGATAEHTFEGTGIRWRGYRFDDAGRAEVRIDDRSVAVVDQFGPGRGLPFDWKVEGLAMGKHTITIRVVEEQSPQSKDRYINVAGFDILP